MFLSIDRILAFSLLSILVVFIVWLWLRIWYFRLAFKARNQVRYRDGKEVSGVFPKMLVGNLIDVYGADNKLSAYHSFHQKFGDIVQIFWLWRSQISIGNYAMARQILVNNQRNYQKFPPNSIIQRLFGESILTFTDTNGDWKRHRLLLNQVFSKKQVAGFHNIFLDYSQQLAAKWNRKIEQSGQSIELNIYPELLALFLDIVGQVAIGKDFAALSGEADEFLDSLKYIVHQSTRPPHQFTKWWKYLPLPSNYKLNQAFEQVDNFLYHLIQQRQAIPQPYSFDVLNLLLRETNTSDGDFKPLTNQEIRDNLLAIIVNGHETVATSVSLSLYFLAQHPEILARAQEEVDRVMEQQGLKLTEAGVEKLDYLNCIILETLRFSPPMAGLQRISRDSDLLSGWSIPSQQVVGITLKPLHHNPEYFGEKPECFDPERYLEREPAMLLSGATTNVIESKCPFQGFLSSNREDKDNKNRTKTGIYFPLTFGDGARKCIAEHFVMYEMKVALATILYQFDLQPVSNFEAELELGKFGLFLTTFPKEGVEIVITPRTHFY